MNKKQFSVEPFEGGVHDMINAVIGPPGQSKEETKVPELEPSQDTRRIRKLHVGIPAARKQGS